MTATTSQDIQDIWAEYIWADADIEAMTTKVINYDPTLDSEKELSVLYKDGEVNCFACTVSRAEQYIGTNTLEYTFTVQVDYIREKDASGNNWIQVRDAFETISDLVRSALGETWQSTIYFYEGQKDPVDISEIDIKGAKCWRGRFNFYAKA